MNSFKKHKYTKLKGENGLTLVEVLASVVLLTIIITIFLNVFIRSAETNTTSEEIVDATYLAQTEMERIYGASIDSTYDDMVVAIQNKGNLKYIRKSDPSCNDYGTCIVFDKKEEGYYIEAKLKKKDLDENDELLENVDHLIIKVYEESASERKLQAQMENILVWEADSE